jgi:capsular polysaccharide biosynthesis protein
MKTSEIRRALRRRWPATALVVVLAIGIAIAVHGQMGSVSTGTATTQILVDSPRSALVNVNVNSAGLTAQASVLAQAMTSQAVLEDIAKAAHVPVGSVSAQGPFAGAGEVLDVPTPSEARSMQVVSIKSAYHIAFVAQQDVPIITVSVQGPNPQAAGHVADSVLTGTETWLSTIAATSTLPKTKQLVLRQLGDAQAGAVNSKTAEMIAIVAFIAVLILGLLAVTLIDRRLIDRATLRRRASELGDLEHAFDREDPESASALYDHTRSGGQDLDENREGAEATRGRSRSQAEGPLPEDDERHLATAGAHAPASNGHEPAEQTRGKRR